MVGTPTRLITFVWGCHLQYNPQATSEILLRLQRVRKTWLTPGFLWLQFEEFYQVCTWFNTHFDCILPLCPQQPAYRSLSGARTLPLDVAAWMLPHAAVTHYFVNFNSKLWGKRHCCSWTAAITLCLAPETHLPESMSCFYLLLSYPTLLLCTLAYSSQAASHVLILKWVKPALFQQKNDIVGFQITLWRYTYPEYGCNYPWRKASIF